MFGIDTKKLKQLSQSNTQIDAVETENEITFEDLVANYKLFMKLVTLIETITNAQELGLKNLKNVVEVLTEDMTEEEYEEFVDLVLKMLFYLKVSQSAIDDLLDEDEEISAMELENLIELIIERMGDNDLYEFVAYAIHNPDLPDDVDTDSIQMDWAFTPDSKGGQAKCEAHIKKINKKRKDDRKKLECFFGIKNGKSGYWHYPKDFESDKGGVSASNHKKWQKADKLKGVAKSGVRDYSKSYSKWLKSMRKRKGEDFGKKTQEKQVSNETGA